MADTHDFGRLFVQPLRLQKTSRRVHLAPTQEVDPPFRRSKGLVLRLRGERGVVLGWWRKSGLDEDAALLAALMIPGYNTMEQRTFEYDEEHLMSEKDKARSQVASNSLDLDDEWALLQTLGLDE